MQIVRWEPFGLLGQWEREFDALVRHSFGDTGGSRGFVPAAEVLRDGDDVVLRLELPGLDVERDVEITVHDGLLTVTGERRTETSDDADGVVRREVRYGRFHRSMALPDGVGAEDVQASYDAGILTIRLRGANAKTQPVRVPVQAGSSAQPAVESAPATATDTEA